MKPRNIFLTIGLLAMIAVFSSCNKSESDEPNDDNSISNYNGKTTAVFNPALTYGSMTDQDGNTYKTVQIGTQTWMAENLRTTKYNDGTAIANINENTEWIKYDIIGYCTLQHSTDETFIATYGMLYNWYAVNTGKLAPSGWHVPSAQEWTTLKTYLGGDNIAGGKLKETGSTHWANSNEGADNSTGFTALPGNCRDGYSGSFDTANHVCYFWTSSEASVLRAYEIAIQYNTALAYTGNVSKNMGYSVRLIKD